MKKNRYVLLCLAVIFVLTLTASIEAQSPAIPSPPPEGSYVLDTLEWLSPDQEKEINTIVSKLDQEQLAEIAVVTLDDCGEDKQKFRNDLFRNWGIGHKDDNDGLLILICWYKGDKSKRSLEQEVGYGMEGTIPDLLTANVAEQYMVPVFTTGIEDSEVIWTGKAGEALVTIVKAYDSIIRGDTPKELEKESLPLWAIIIIILIVIIILVLIIIMFTDDTSYGGGSGGSWGGGDDGGGISFGGGSAGGGGGSTSI